MDYHEKKTSPVAYATTGLYSLTHKVYRFIQTGYPSLA